MGTVVVNVSLTLDGVMQATGRPDEGVRDGFAYGGWARPYFDLVMGTSPQRVWRNGLRCYSGDERMSDFYAVWPKRSGNPFTEVLNNSEKYVASRTLKPLLPWSNSTLLGGDAVAGVARLKEQPGKDLAEQ